MKHIIIKAHAAVFAVLLPLSAQVPTPSPAASSPPAANEKSDDAYPKAANGILDPTFIQAHESYVKIAKENQSGVLFLGDSITSGWRRYPEVWKTFAPYHPANFGIKGDRTQHVLWRITNGELDGFTPKVVVLLIGTNNIGNATATIAGSVSKIAGSVCKIVDTIREKTPTSKILLIGIFPRGENPGPARDSVNQVNALLAKKEDGKTVFFMDFGDKFLEPDGKISKEVMGDFLHPTPKGYQIWADAMGPKLAELMK